MVHLEEFVDKARKFDYVFGDLTDTPISDTPTGEIWDFIRCIWEHSFKILNTGKYLTHANSSLRPDLLSMFEDELAKLTTLVKVNRANAYVPSFMEDWVFYQVRFADI